MRFLVEVFVKGYVNLRSAAQRHLTTAQMLLPLIEGCEQVGWRMVIKFEGDGGTGDEMSLEIKST